MDKTSDVKVYITDNYSIFKRLDGNRAVADRRVDKIIQSINTIGYVTSPILVNEKMEVIDGQGRLSALERLKLPVEYIIHDGIGIKECRQMNIHQSNWTERDYVKSYATLGDKNYARLQSLIDSFSQIPIQVIVNACNQDTFRDSESKIKRGTFKVSEKDAEKAKWELYYVSNFKQVAKNLGGSKRPFYMAVIYAYRNLDIDQRNRLEEVVRARQFEFPSLSKVPGYLKYFDAFYNEKQRKDKRIHLSIQYQMDYDC